MASRHRSGRRQPLPPYRPQLARLVKQPCALTPRLQPSRFNVSTIERRLGALRQNPWAAYFTARQGLTRSMFDAVRRL